MKAGVTKMCIHVCRRGQERHKHLLVLRGKPPKAFISSGKTTFHSKLFQSMTLMANEVTNDQQKNGSIVLFLFCFCFSLTEKQMPSWIEPGVIER